MTEWPTESALAAILDALPDATYLIDPTTSNILYCNRAGHEDLGYGRSDVLGHAVLSLQKDVTGLPQWSQIAESIRQSSPYVFLGRQAGHEVSVEIHTTTAMLEGREVFISVARDARRRVQLDNALLARQAHVQFALNEASDGLWDWHIPTSEVYFSPQLKRMLGYGPHEMSPTLEAWTSCLHPDDKPLVLTALDDHINGLRERYQAEYRLQNRNGHYLWVHDRGRVCERDASGKPTRVVGMVRNITDQKNVEAHLLSMATQDSLTGLGNRRECEERLQKLMHTCQRLGVPMGMSLLDVDHFKDINDTFGHRVGDEVLVRMAKTLSGAIRSSDGLYRWGGEEFVLLCPGLDTDAMLQLCTKLCKLVADMDWSSLLGNHHVTASFGVAVMPASGADAGLLMAAADSAMYQAKARGRNRVCVAEPPDAPAAPAEPVPMAEGAGLAAALAGPAVVTG